MKNLCYLLIVLGIFISRLSLSGQDTSKFSSFYNDGKYEELISISTNTDKQSLKTEDLVELLYLVGKSHLELGDEDAAYDSYMSVKELLDSLSLSATKELFYYKNIGSELKYLRDFEASKSCYLKAIMYQKELKSQPDSLAKSYMIISEIYDVEDNFKSGLKYIDSSIFILENSNNPSSDIVSALLHRANLYLTFDKLTLAEIALDACEPRLSISEDEIDYHWARGSYCRKIDDEKRALDHFNIAYEKSSKTLGVSNSKTLNCLKQVGESKAQLRDHKGALAIGENLIEAYRKKYGKNSIQVAGAYESFGSILFSMDSNDEAIEYFKLTEHIYRTTMSPQSLDLAFTHINLGESYYFNEEYLESLSQYRKAKSIAETKLAPDHIVFAALAYYSGNALADLNRYDEAFQLYEKAKVLLGYKKGDLTNLKSYSKAAELHFNIAHSYQDWYEVDSLVKYLYEAKDAYDEGYHLLQSARKRFISKDSKQYLTQKYRNTLEKMVYNEYRLYEVDDSKEVTEVVALIDHLKNNELKDDIFRKEALNYGNIDQSYLVREALLADSILNISRRLDIVRTEQLDSILTIARLEANLTEVKFENEKLLTELEDKYPHYYELKYDWSTVDIDVFRETKIDSDEVLISFFYGKEYIFVASLGRSFINLHKIKNSDNFTELLTRFIKDIHTSYGDKWMDDAYAIYSELLGPVMSTLPLEIMDVTFLPDGLLTSVPFEVLVTDTLEDTKMLIERYNIKYNETLKLINPNTKTQSNMEVYAFAPDYMDYNENTPKDEQIAALVRAGEYQLPGSQEEVTMIAKQCKTHLHKNQKASKSKFVNTDYNNGIIHLSMHAIVNGEHPLESKLAFGSSETTADDPYLYAHELYGMNLNADMAVLSACNTGAGKIINGEGVQSLSRAFQYAGVPSTVMSLWKVPDASTKEIMVSFYGHLKEDKTKSEALRLAKLDFIRNNKIMERNHPMYWAGFIFCGQDGVVDLADASGSMYKYLFLVLAILLGLYFFSKKLE